MQKRIIFIITAVFFIILGSQSIGMAGLFKYNGKIIKKIVILKNKFVKKDVILKKIKTKVGSPFNKETIDHDLNRLYLSGYFDKLSISVDNVKGGLRLSIIVEEKPTLKEIIFTGNKKIKKRKLKKLMDIPEGGLLRETKIKEGVEKIKDYYEGRGFSSAEVNYDISVDKASRRAIVTVDVKEGTKIHVARVTIVGNKQLRTKAVLKVIRTRRHTLFRAGILKAAVFQDDLDRIIQLYSSKGYLDAKVIDVKRRYDREKAHIWITIHISEGRKYFINKTEITGNKKFPLKKLAKLIKGKPQDVFTPGGLNRDIARLRDFYYERGYLDASIRAATSVDESTGNINIVYKIVEGEISYIRRVDIEGNTRTKDIVIRREITVVPGEICNSIKMKRSQEKLRNMGYFKYVDVSVRPTEEKQKKDVVVDVQEQKTGEIAFGAGYSSIDNLIGFIELSQKNFDITNFPSFTGGGEKLRLRTEFGSKRRDYILSFTEPWFLGRHLSVGFDLFKSTSQYFSDYYDEKREGGDVRFGVGLGDFNRLDMIYKYQMVEITNVVDKASSEIKREAGKHYVGSIGLNLSRDTRDNWIFPTRGYKLVLSPEMAGLGGDTKFMKLTGSGSIYLPLLFKNVLHLGAKGGIMDRYGSTKRVPIFDRFFLGGADTIRGFDYRDISPRDEFNESIGGNTMGMATVEDTFPLISRIRGAVFFDIGGVFPDAGEFHFDKLNAAVGVGVRLSLPIGPIRVDYGIPVVTDDANNGANPRFTFSMGTTF